VTDASLESKVALVTGAARRVGAAIARRLHAAGASVVIHYRGAEADAARLEKELNAARPGSALKLRGDLLAPVAPKALVDAALQRFARLDILVNNASAFYPTALGQIEASHWEELIGSNLRAPLFLAQAAAPQLALAAGSIVNIADIHAERPLKGYVVYSVAKAGLAALTRSLALELAPGVRVNAVAPGAIAWPEDGQFAPGERDRIVATTPMRRTGTPEEIAQAVHFLATAPFVTGQVLAVDGGRSIFL
jgi:pteridine reductase